MKVTGLIWYTLAFTCLLETIKAEALLQEKIQQQLLNSVNIAQTIRIKRPFCNAFTGCGKKRSLYRSLNDDDKDVQRSDFDRLPIPFYRALLRAANQEIRDEAEREFNDYRIPDVLQDYTVYLALHKLPMREHLRTLFNRIGQLPLLK
ncbi:uncharacterized protein CCAP [Prorops nasuta]|uniref:uncharacterized protein CCAP n=1 Tax=Prorops nasuta TaxID=863751 RepID=UPI0034CFF95E